MARWFINHRQEFIRGHLKTFGQIRRADLVGKFDISPQQASADISLFLDLNSDALIYDGRAKLYVLNDGPLSPTSDQPGDGHG